MKSEAGEITRLLRILESGREEAGPNLLALLFYAELGRIAAVKLRNERAGHTLTPTALVHQTRQAVERPAEQSGFDRLFRRPQRTRYCFESWHNEADRQPRLADGQGLAAPGT